MPSFENRVAGVLWGTAYGDALGATVEKLTYAQIKELYGKVISVNVPWHKADYPIEERMGKMRGYGIITDDTLMTVALIETYLIRKRHLDCWDMGETFLKRIMYTKRFIPEFGKEGVIFDRLFYPERYIFQRHVLANCDPREGGYGNMINCGAAMYIAPIGVVNAGNPRMAYSEAISFACGHQASYGLEAAGVLAACVSAGFKRGATIDTVIEAALAYAKDGTKRAILAVLEVAERYRERKIDNPDIIVSEFHRALEPFSPMKDDINRKEEKFGVPSNHYTPSRLFSIEELPIALGYLKLYNGDFKKSIIEAVNSGRDTDSIGVMVGAICGSLYGDQIISSKVKRELEETNHIPFSCLITEFTSIARQIMHMDYQVNKEIIVITRGESCDG